MATIAKKLLTAEEFARLPDPGDGSRCELIRGEVVHMSPAGGRHGACCTRAILLLGDFVRRHGLGHVLANDTGVILQRAPDTVRAPDVGFWSREKLPSLPVGFVELPPDLAVEVTSPTDRFSVIQRRVQDFLASGVRLVWVVDPEDRTVSVCRPGQQPIVREETETLDGEDVLPGFQCQVSDLLP